MTPADFLLAPITEVKGIGPARAATLARLDIRVVGDLLHHFPQRHDDLTCRSSVHDLEEGRPVTLFGTVRSVEHRGGTKPRWTAVFEVDGDRVALVWFSPSRRPPPIAADWTGFATGVLRRYGGPQFVHPRVFRTDDPEARAPGHNRLRPIYATTEGIESDAVAKWVDALLNDPRLELDHGWPDATIERGRDRTIGELYRALHFPESWAERSVALSALGECELWLFCQRQARRRAQREGRRAAVVAVTEEIDDRIRARFPFPFTGAQDRVVAEVCEDLERGYPMARLVQGEVGSGKTAVAIYAALAVVAAGGQVAILAPTAPLARQHHESLLETLDRSRVSVDLLIAGSDRGGEVRARLRTGECSIVVGTHALLSKDVEFSNLRLAIVDEEQRFGVGQRGALAAKGEGVHRLHLSATPIPRTLALALVGDFELSSIDEMPPGRQPVQTRRVESDRLAEAAKFIADELAAGRRALFVAPRIDDSEPAAEGVAEDLPSVEQLAGRLRKTALSRFPIVELHGRLSTEEQLARVARFREGEAPLLVATTLVEVGLDVPGVTVLWIEGADRFGLSQLHQLRGRLGRRGEKAWCFFTVSAPLPGDGEEGESPRKELAEERLEAFRTRADGFELAEEDLRLRGEGETIGARQSGFLPFRLRHPREDLAALADLRRRVSEGGSGAEDPIWARLEPFFAAGSPPPERGA